MNRPLIAVVAGLLLGGGLAFAQAPQSDPNKMDAKALMQSGLKLFEAKDYLGALAVFKTAYARFPSAKILLNIGTTLKELGRNAEAANAYQAYLDAPESDPAKRGQVQSLVADLDKLVGKLQITVTPPDAELQINNEDWLPAEKAKLYRVAPGQFTINARKPKFQAEAKQAQVGAGETSTLAFTLTAIPEEDKQLVGTSGGGGAGNTDTGVPAQDDDDFVRSRWGMLAIGHFDVPFDRAPRGGALFVGGTGDITGQLQAHAALIIGPTAETDVTLSGVYGGASFAFLPGNLRPIAAAGFPVFFSNGARFAVRVAGGVEYQLNRHISLIAELGLEYVFNPEPMYVTNLFVPALGASGRL